MADKKYIRSLIISAAKIYRDNLAGKKFLYCYGKKHFEVIFKTDRFMHLTGTVSTLPAKKFYDLSKNSMLTTEQFGFDQTHPYALVKNKLYCLSKLPQITNSLVCIVEDFTTFTMVYRLGVTNLKFTVGMTELPSIPGCYVPQTLRVKDKSVENSVNAEFVDFIFEKDASASIYSVIAYKDESKHPPEDIKELLSKELSDELYKTEIMI